ncbi:hypothetical protein [Streptomyces sp. MMBL 11-1]|uniref:hypothetical protein n=1 Tax=Streptomyces sp. MMBL 11-1 TaxID=3026420 RepID=UPI00235F71D5|nr:hypothetical protein [Streptomyces sp. MMBL 11-1]
MSTRNENMVAALRRERAAYVAKGKDDRVDQVDDQLRRLGADPEPDKGDGPQDRTPADPAQQTTDQSPGPNTEAATVAAADDGAQAAPPAQAKKTGTTRRSTAKE